MKKSGHLLTALLFALGSTLAFAEGPPGAGEKGERGDRPHPPRDCSKAPDAEKKARCEAHQAAMAKCKDMQKEEHRKCMHEAMPKKDK